MELQPAARRRQRQREEARRAILESAQTLLVEEGNRSFSMRRLADRCGYTTPTIYHYFQDKKTLLDALLEERFAQLLGIMKAVPQGGDPIENWRQMTLAFIDFGLRYPDHYRLLTTPRGEDETPPPVAEELLNLVAKPLEDLEAQGRFVPEDSEAGRQAAWALIHGLVSLRSSLPEYAWSDGVVSAAVDMMVRGLTRPQADS